MEVIRYKYIFTLITLFSYCVNNEKAKKLKENSHNNHTTNCPYTKLFEDIFKIHNKSPQSDANDSERVKLFLNTLANSSSNNKNVSTAEDLVDTIIASINRIKKNITSDKISNETKLNEAIILNIPTESSKSAIRTTKKNYITEGVKIKSGVEEKADKNKLNFKTTNNTSVKCGTSDIVNSTSKDIDAISTTEESTYVEILTIEPNNTKPANTTSHNIIDILKRLMPMFNSTLTKELHNITIIERTHNRNHSISTTKNISTIVVTYCDNENLTKANVTPAIYQEESFIPMNNSQIDDYFDFNSGAEDLTDDKEGGKQLINTTFEERKDILEAAEYGMQKMHELYSIIEPKLYSMGLWLEDFSPARYVAAFNAPSEEAARFTRYGYAALQAATRLKELTSDNGGLESRTEELQFPGTSELRQAPLLQHCPLLEAPKCPPASKRYRTHDGTCNNLSKPRWGSTMTPVQRFIPPSYSDGLQAPRRSVTGSKLPSAREISSTIHKDQFVENHGITHLLMQWGQFIDHDITSTSQSRGFNGSVPRCCKDGGKDFVPREFLHPECFPISVPASDPFYGPRGIRCLDFIRSSPAPRGDCALGWRDQMNQVTAFIDGSPLYGSSARQSDKLRLFRNGMLQYGRVSQRRPVLPASVSREELCRGGAVSTDCFRSGDGRVNEHPGLVAKHIVWLRLHNRLAQELAHLNPHWSDEKIYQETRKIIGAMIQHITYREFLPVVLGGDVIRLFDLEPLKKGNYKGYSPKVDPSPAGSFGSAAFRFGHSLVQPSMVRYDRFHRPIDNNVSLHDELTNPSNIWSMGAVDRLIIGMVNQPIQKRDEFITEELTNHLFQTPQFSFGMDLAAINIQRGRDHGIPPYTSWREPCGLSVILEFEDLFRVMPARAVRKLEALYRSVDDIDLFTGGMAERPVVGGLVGPTFACIIAQQFSNLRKGDRFWYENGGFESSFTPAQLQQIRRISLAQVLCRTLDNIDNIQPFAFLSPEHSNNERISCQDGKLNTIDLSPWKEINADSNDLGKSNDVTTSTQKPKKSKPIIATTTKPISTNANILSTVSNTLSQKRIMPSSMNSSKSHNKGSEKIKTAPPKTEVIANSRKQNRTKINNAQATYETTTKLISTVQKIDDKLDFNKNKRRHYENSETINTRNNYNEPEPKYNDYDYEDDNTQSIQSVVINNSHNKRPYRPVIAVTENLNKFTYLINYVPKPTQSWRPTTKKSYHIDRDVIKVTYQNYDETYRRPTHHNYYNRQNDENRNNDYISHRLNRPTVLKTDKHTYDSSARSNDHDDINTTTESDDVHKLVTFGYVGTYKGDHAIENTLTKSDQIKKNDIKQSMSKDFSTYESQKLKTDFENENKKKLSTFLFYDTVTRPYRFLQRPTRRDDDGPTNDDSNSKNKYYYVRNVLHKYPDIDFTEKPLFEDVAKGIFKENYTSYSTDAMIENRSADDQELEPKLIKPNRFVDKRRKPGNEAKTPSVSFQVIPSENSPSQWAVYEENTDLSEDLPTLMPLLKSDPHALKEFPKPLSLLNLKRRRPGIH